MIISKLTKSDSMFTLACEQALNFWVRKCQPIKTLIRLFSHVKNIVCSEIRVLFQPNTTRKSPYSYNKGHFSLKLFNKFRRVQCKMHLADQYLFSYSNQTFIPVL